MKNITGLLLICLLLHVSCQQKEESQDIQVQALDEEELRRVTMLIDPTPATYQEGQINDLVEFALQQEWPIHKSPSGLLYWIQKPGNEVKPSRSDVVVVRYKGSLIDGKVFDQSPTSGEPAQFSLRGVIPAWQEALSLIGEEGKITILAHSDLAYGNRRMGNMIPPYTPLIFEIELLHVNRQ